MLHFRAKSFNKLNHSHKKRRDLESLEIRAKRTVLYAYVENQAILELVLLYRASKYKQVKIAGLLRLFVSNCHFTFLCD